MTHASPGAAARPPVETLAVTAHRVACDGPGGALGHPRVWLELGADHKAECPYCGRLFVLKAGGAH